MHVFCVSLVRVCPPPSPSAQPPLRPAPRAPRSAAPCVAAALARLVPEPCRAHAQAKVMGANVSAVCR